MTTVFSERVVTRFPWSVKASAPSGKKKLLPIWIKRSATESGTRLGRAERVEPFGSASTAFACPFGAGAAPPRFFFDGVGVVPPAAGAAPPMSMALILASTEAACGNSAPLDGVALDEGDEAVEVSGKWLGSGKGPPSARVAR